MCNRCSFAVHGHLTLLLPTVFLWAVTWFAAPLAVGGHGLVAEADRPCEAAPRSPRQPTCTASSTLPAAMPLNRWRQCRSRGLVNVWANRVGSAHVSGRSFAALRQGSFDGELRHSEPRRYLADTGRRIAGRCPGVPVGTGRCRLSDRCHLQAQLAHQCPWFVCCGTVV